MRGRSLIVAAGILLAACEFDKEQPTSPNLPPGGAAPVEGQAPVPPREERPGDQEQQQRDGARSFAAPTVRHV